jgi:hypothetical protein
VPAINVDKHIAYQNNEIYDELIEFKNNKVLKYRSYLQYYDIYFSGEGCPPKLNFG